MPICRHCERSFEPQNPSASSRMYCYELECISKEEKRVKAYEKQWRKDNPQRHTHQRSERKSYRKRNKGGEQWPCQDCGKMSTNRLHSPKCKAKRIATAGNCEGDPLHGITPDDRKEEYYERW